MAKKIASKEKQNQNLNNHALNLDTIYTKEIVSAFSKKMDAQEFDFFSLPKDELVAKFEEFVRDEYGDNILEALRD